METTSLPASVVKKWSPIYPCISVCKLCKVGLNVYIVILISLTFPHMCLLCLNCDFDFIDNLQRTIQSLMVGVVVVLISKCLFCQESTKWKY